LTKDEGFRIDPAWKGVVKWGGLSLFAAGIILVLFIVSVFGAQQELPVPAEEMLEDPAAPTALFTLAAIGEFLLLPGAFGLFFLLKDVRKAAMFMATVLMMVAVPLFIASRGLIISISALSGRYLDTTSASMRESYLASAELALETQNMYAMIGLTLLSVWSIIVGYVMLKSGFGKRMGYVVVIAGLFTSFSSVGVMLNVPMILPFIGLILTAVWQSIVGMKLFKMDKEA
jgi:hypothetical protein